MNPSDERIGRNLAALRSGMSQAALAASMREHGWKWSQPTVAAIEKGERGLKLTEAETLAHILGIERLEDLLDRPLDDLLWNARVRLDRELDAVERATRGFYDAQLALARVLDETAERHGFRPEDNSEWTYHLTATPHARVDLVAPSQPVTPEAVEDSDEPVGAWVAFLASSNYGKASAEGVLGAEAAYPTE